MNMPSIHELYTSVYGKLREIDSRYGSTEQSLHASQEQDAAAKALRIERIQLQLKQIGEYYDKIDQFRKMAEKHMNSKNLLTIPAIIPRQLNFNRMRNWAMAIDPTDSDDPYARRIYALARCNEKFLDQKRAELEGILASLQREEKDPAGELEAAMGVLREQLIFQCREVLEGEEFAQMAAGLALYHERGRSDVPTLAEEESPDGTVGLGGYALPLPIFPELRYLAKAKLNEFYDAQASSVIFPVEQDLAREHVITVSCVPAREKRLYRGIQNYLLNLICAAPPGTRRIYVVDALHFNSSVLGVLRPLLESAALEPIPKSTEQILDTLKQIVSSFSDIDDALGLADSVAEFNAAAKPEERLERKVLVLVGYPSAFPAEARTYIDRILLNHEHYGVSLVLIDTRSSARRGEQQELLEDAADSVLRVEMLRQQTFIRQNNGPQYHFRWYELNQELPEEFVSALKRRSERTGTLGNEYIKRVDMEKAPSYERGNKSIVLPYGVDSADKLYSISFDNENFACYLMGASGSGKSTLLHTLITGILMKYHPDDVELWLADFKMSEFAQYVDPMPPHVKYILLDESQELVFDLLDRLTEKMMERQRFFMRNRGLKKVENVKDVYMPVIFVILDEFSIMSQAVAEAPGYKLKLQNLLAKGRTLGIKFIFSSQDFTKGIGGLTATAKDQIQARIAMKNTFTEINNTLELSPDSKTDQVRNWMEALPPHYALIKYREGEKIHVERVNVLYFKGEGDAAYKPQRDLIKRLKDAVRPTEDYQAENAGTYVDKHPVVVDGNSYEAFDREGIRQYIRTLSEGGDYTGDEIFAFPGRPRLMCDRKEVAVTPESRQNFLLLCESSEKNCGAAVTTSIMESFRLQGKEARVWAYERSSVYRAVRDEVWKDYRIETNLERICDEIYDLRQRIQRGEHLDEQLVVLLGFESICADFEFLGARKADKPATPPPPAFEIDSSLTGAVLGADEEEDSAAAALRAQFLQSMASRKPEEDEEEEDEEDDEDDEDEGFIDLSSLEFSALLSGAAKEEPAVPPQQPAGESALEGATAEEKSASGEAPEAEPAEKPKPEPEPEPKPEEPAQSRVYNAREDLKYILQNGSRRGVHFLLYLNTYSDLKQTGLPAELFRHRMAFQISADDSRMLFGSSAAMSLPEHICLYTDMLERFSFRPYLHAGLSWDGWGIDEEGTVLSPFN